MLIPWLRKTLHRLAPSLCHLCRLPIERELGETIWCRTCLSYFSPTPRCQQCGLPMPTETEKCGQCLTHPPLWDNLYCIGDYQPPLSDYIHQLKFDQQPAFAHDLSYLLSSRIPNPAPLMIPVPLHWQRRLVRGYNQSALLADGLTIHFGHRPTVLHQAFVRNRSTPFQTRLSQQARRTNLRNAFTLNIAPTGPHIAIVDDVVTTGSTVTELCKLLHLAGSYHIDIYCLARTP